MKRALFKQLMVSALFVCSLSADVPDVGQISKHPTSNHAKRAASVEFIPHCAGNQLSAFGLAAHQTGACLPLNPSAWRGADAKLCGGYVLSMPVRSSAMAAGTASDPMAWVLSAVWPMDGSDRACVRWEVPPSVSRETMDFPTDPLETALLVPRYRMPLALQESAWPAFAEALRAGRSCPVGSGLSESAPCVTKTMAAMIPRLKQVFVKEGVPQQWVWMAEVESALNPQAISSAGAAGLFQLMPGTAQRFGLRTTPVDDRMEPEKSAGAAAQYLKFLRQEFGCWSLALAAYNAGEGRVKEIMKKRKARTFDEVERYLPSETQAYVPKVMAVVALREDRLHGVPGSYWMP